VGKITEKAVCRSVFLSAEWTKTHSSIVFLAIFPLGHV